MTSGAPISLAPRPSFGLSNWASPDDDDAWAAWQARVDAGLIGNGGGAHAANAMADEMARVVLGRPVRPGAAAGPSTSGGAGTVFHLDMASTSSTSGVAAGCITSTSSGTAGVIGAGEL